MSGPDSQQRHQQETGAATGILQSIEDFISPVLSVCTPISSGGGNASGYQRANARRGAKGIGSMSARERQEKTAKLMQMLESDSQVGQKNAENDGVWFVENFKDDQVHYAFPKGDFDVLIKNCAGLLDKTTVMLSQPCRMLAVSKCKNMKVLLDIADEEILVCDCENVEIIIGNSVPKVGVSFSSRVKLVCSNTRNVAPPIETRKSTDVTCQCAMTRPGLCSAAEVEKAPKFNSQSIDGDNAAVGNTQAVQHHFASHPDSPPQPLAAPTQLPPPLAMGPPVPSFGIYVAQHDFTASEADEISLRKGQTVQIDGLGEDIGWLRAIVPSHHGGHYGDGRGVVPVTHIRPAEKCEVQAVHDYQGRNPDELTFQKNDMLTLICHSEDEGWWVGMLKDKFGLIPETHVLNARETIAKMPLVSTNTPTERPLPQQSSADHPPATAPGSLVGIAQTQGSGEAGGLGQAPKGPSVQADNRISRFPAADATGVAPAPPAAPAPLAPHVTPPGTCLQCGAQYVKGQVFCRSCHAEL